MKRFKELTEELLNEGGEMYPADEMTISELKIACYSAQNILGRLEEGAMIQRWQISAIVKAKEELATVYTAMSADEGDDDEWEDEMDDEEPMYVGFEYPSMYGEEVELDENIGGVFKNASEWESSAKARGLVVKSMTHPSGEMTKYQIAKDKQGNNRGHFDHGIKSGRLKEEVEFYEETDYEVDVEGLPKMYVKANNPGEVKTNLRKVVRNPELIRGVERVAKATLQKIFRDKASGKDTEE
jgi:hypothetical protein